MGEKTQMKIDSHQHFWKYNKEEYWWMDPDMTMLKSDRLPEDLAPLLKDVGLDGSVTVQARQKVIETEWLLELAAKNPFMKGVVGWVPLISDTVEADLERFSSNEKLKGVRHVLHDEEDDKYMLREDFLSGISKLEKFNLVYDFLIFTKHVNYTIELVDKFPNQMFAVDHIAKPFIKKGEIQPWKQEMEELAKRENVYCKVSGMVTEASWDGWKKEDFGPYMEAVLEMFSAERVMFGSDWPVCTVAASYQQVHEIVADFIKSLSPDEQAQIMGMSAANFYKLEP